MSRTMPVPVFTDCSVANGGTVTDVQVGGPYDGFYKATIQVVADDFVESLTGTTIHFPGPGEGRSNWAITFRLLVADPTLDNTALTRHPELGPVNAEVYADWQWDLEPVQGLNFEWVPGRDIRGQNIPLHGGLARFSIAGDQTEIFGETSFLGADVAIGQRLIPLPDNFAIAPSTTFPHSSGGVGYDRYGYLRDQFCLGGTVYPDDPAVWGPSSPYRVAPGGSPADNVDHIGDTLFFDPAGPKAWKMQVWRTGMLTPQAINSGVQFMSPVSEYVINLPGSAGVPAGNAESGPPRIEMSTWDLDKARQSVDKTKLYNTLAIYEGGEDGMDHLTEVDSSPNSSLEGNGVTFDAVEGKEYHIQVGTGRDGVNGSAVLTWE